MGTCMTRSRPIPRRAFITGLAGIAGAAAFAPRDAARANGAFEPSVVQPWEIKSLEPREAGHMFRRAGVTETLTAVNPDGTIAPGLARRWGASEDARVWRFELRPGALFHDGTPVDGPAVLRALERLLPRAQYLSAAGITAMETDGAAIVLRTAEPFTQMPAYLSDSSAPILARASFGDAGDVMRLVATGPYKIETADLPRAIKLQRYDGHWSGIPGAARAEFLAVTNGETRSNIAMSGDSHLVFNIPSSSAGRVDAAGRARIDRAIVPRVHILMLNAALPQFADTPVRRALGAAIDRGAIATAIMRNPALAATHYLPPTFKNWIDPNLAPLSYNMMLANRLLDEAGWARGADGIRAKNGKRFTGTLKTFANRPELPVIATNLQAQFRQIGFDLTIKIGDWTDIYEAQKDGSLELGLSSRNVAQVPDPIASIGADFTGTISPGATGATNWRHQPMIDAVASYRQTVDERQLDAARRRIVSILHAELPVIPIVWYDQIVAVRRDVAGFVNDPFEQNFHMDRLRPGA